MIALLIYHDKIMHTLSLCTDSQAKYRLIEISIIDLLRYHDKIMHTLSLI